MQSENKESVSQPKLDVAEIYKNEQKARMSKYVIGGKDINESTISNIYSRHDEFVIYEISGVRENESFRIVLDPIIESDKELLYKLEEIEGDIANFRSILYKGIHDTSIKHRAAHAISSALRGNNVAKAQEIFEGIKDQVTKEYESILFGKLLYLSGAFGFLFLLLGISVYFYICREEEWLKHILQLKNIIYASAFAGCGGLLSVCINLRFMRFERALKGYAYCIYGVQRIVLAALGGIFAYILIEGRFLFTFVLESKNPLIAIMAVCVASGFSETLIPNALRKLESIESKDKKT